MLVFLSPVELKQLLVAQIAYVAFCQQVVLMEPSLIEELSVARSLQFFTHLKPYETMTERINYLNGYKKYHFQRFLQYTPHHYYN